MINVLPRGGEGEGLSGREVLGQLMRQTHIPSCSSDCGRQKPLIAERLGHRSERYDLVTKITFGTTTLKGFTHRAMILCCDGAIGSH